MSSHPLDHPLVTIWIGLISRCHSPSNPAFHHYGGRGIQVCRRWMSFPNFAKDMGDRPSPQHSIERNDVNRGYSPANCRWATTTEQARNTRRTRWLSYDGRRQSLAAWAEELGLKQATLRNRLRRGWPVDVALSTTAQRKRLNHRVIQRRTTELCRAAGISTSCFQYRLSKGWTEQQALSVPPRTARGRIAERCVAAGIALSAFYDRLRRGWSEEEALHTPPRQLPIRLQSSTRK